MDPSLIVAKALKYYDVNREKYNSIFNKIKYYQYIVNLHDMENNVIILYDENKKVLYKSKYEILGAFSKQHATWIWAWSLPTLTKNQTYISRKMLNYGLDLDHSEIMLKTELITSRFRVTNQIQLDIYIAISSYITHQPIIFKVVTVYDEEKGDIKKIGDTRETYDYLIYYICLLDQDQFHIDSIKE